MRRLEKRKEIPSAVAWFMVGLICSSCLRVSSVGYSWLPLLKEGRLSSQEFSIPVSCNLPPGYLAIKEASNTKVTSTEKKKEGVNGRKSSTLVMEEQLVGDFLSVFLISLLWNRMERM